MIAINKADGDNIPRAQRAAAEYRGALQILTPQSALWHPPVVTVSGAQNLGLDALWSNITGYRDKLTASGDFQKRRQRQTVEWMRDMISDRLLAAMRANPAVANELPALELDVRDGRLLPTLAADRVLALMGLGSG